MSKDDYFTRIINVVINSDKNVKIRFEENILMWFPEEDVKRILSELPSECAYIDYKVIPYSENKKHDFIKDVIAMLNSPESLGVKKYIIFGVNNDKQLVGIDKQKQPDDNEFQNWADNITPRPQLQTGTVCFEGKLFGYVYILDSNDHVVHEVKNSISGEKNYKSVGKNAVLRGQAFFRRGSRNEIMMQSDRERVSGNKTQEKVLFLPPNISTHNCDVLNVLALVGSWDETREGDRKIIERISGKEYTTFQSELRSFYSNNQDVISFSNNVWKANARNQLIEKMASRVFEDQIDILQKATYDVISFTDPFLDLFEKDNVDMPTYSELVNTEVQYTYSDILRKSIFEFWAYVGNNDELFVLLSKNIIKRCIRDIIVKVIHCGNSKVLMTNSKMLSLLAEAYPEVFLCELRDAILDNDVGLGDILKKDDDNMRTRGVVYSLSEALGLLATYKDYFSKAGLCLIALSDKNEVFLDKISMIMLPWYPQTEVEADVRMGFLKAAFMDYSDNAWLLILKLLPNHRTNSYPIEKARYMPQAVISSNGVVNKDYWDEIVRLISLACIQAKGNPSRLIDLIPIMDDVIEESRKEILFTIKDEFIDLSDDYKYQIWLRLSDLVNLHKRHSDAEWALSAEQLLLLETVEFEFEKNVWLSKERRLFRRNQWKLLEDTKKYQESEKKIRQEQFIAVKRVYELGNKVYIKFLDKIENEKLFGMCMASVEVSKDTWEYILNMFTCKEEHHIDFAKAFVQESYCRNSAYLIKYLQTAIPENAALIFENLPITQGAIDVIEKVNLELQKRYWKNVEVYNYKVPQNKREYVINKLLEYGRENDVFRIIYLDIEQCKNSISGEIVANTLLSCSANKEIGDNSYITEYLINFVEESDVDEGKKVLVEWKYLDFLMAENTYCAKSIYRQFGEKPAEFIRAFSLMNKGAVDDEIKSSNYSIYTLLESWRRIPGTNDDGILDRTYFSKWFTEVMELAEKSEIKDSVEHYLGKLFFHAPPSEDGLFIDRTVAKLLHSDQRGHMLNGYLIEAINSRGVCFVDETGNAEFKLEQEYREKAKAVEIEGFTRLADILRSIARNYHDEALYNIEEAKKWRGSEG